MAAMRFLTRSRDTRRCAAVRRPARRCRGRSACRGRRSRRSAEAAARSASRMPASYASRSDRVVPDGERLPRAAEDHLLLRRRRRASAGCGSARSPPAGRGRAGRCAAPPPGRVAARAAPISSAVRTAVPDGESTLPAPCASTISIESKKRAATVANAVPSAEPSEKLGMTTAPRALVRGDAALEVEDAVGRPPGRADQDVQPVVDGEGDDAGADRRERHVDQHVGAEHLLERRARSRAGRRARGRRPAR